MLVLHWEKPKLRENRKLIQDGPAHGEKGQDLHHSSLPRAQVPSMALYSLLKGQDLHSSPLPGAQVPSTALYTLLKGQEPAPQLCPGPRCHPHHCTPS